MKNETRLNNRLPEILFITSYPPRECGIATYSQDLIKALNNKFSNSFTIRVCPLESENENHVYTDEIKYLLNVDHQDAFTSLVKNINHNANIRLVMIQHEFGFFEKKKDEFMQFLNALTKPVAIVFHTVLPHPNESLKENVQKISGLAESIIVMTKFSAGILTNDYGIQQEKITVIPHGTHLVPHLDKQFLKNKYQLQGKKVLSTFGLLSSGKSIETTLEALPVVVKTNPNILFLVIGKTHPSVIKNEGEKYRNMLEAKVAELQLQRYVKFINYFLPLPDLLEYLQLTDIYLFTSKDPNQAVSGTFSYAISCGCPIISTPIPHAREVLKNDAGIIFDFENPKQLSEAITGLLKNEELRKNIGSNGLHRMASTAWENAAIAHALLFERICNNEILLRYNVPAINLDHVKKLTTGFGMIQFSKLNHPDIDSGYTLDDNARALIAMCRHFELTRDENDLKYITIYFNFIKSCQQPGGNFFNYISQEKKFTEQNNYTNLEDANGRSIWALGYLLSLSNLFPAKFISGAESIMQTALLNVNKIHSTRAMAFVIKGLYYRNTKNKSVQDIQLIKEFTNRLVQMYRHEKNNEWQWFESYLTYANSLLPEAILCAWIVTGEPIYKEIARTSFDFLLSKIFVNNSLKVISNKSWLYKEEPLASITTGGEQPIDVAYTILALKKFYHVFKDEEYRNKIEIAFNWFLGNNHLHQIIYNPCTGGCYDGLEENYVNLNQGAESTISYLLARLTVDTGYHYRSGAKQKINIREGYLINQEKAISLKLA
ncbi:MAG TPA: glycosyltransferase [Chitinophagaceae bacterium]|jgi:glycosyltransferase involved in cell wall biosynthesis|nr:glycosyltransferase [Chitinophagaceae bacterium]